MKETESSYQQLTPFQANFLSLSLPQVPEVVLHTRFNVYTDGLEGSCFVAKGFLMC